MGTPVRCLKCEDIIESLHRHDFKYCSCGAVGVDGGDDYLRLLGKPEDRVVMTKDKNVMPNEEIAELLEKAYVEGWADRDDCHFPHKKEAWENSYTKEDVDKLNDK